MYSWILEADSMETLKFDFVFN